MQNDPGTPPHGSGGTPPTLRFGALMRAVREQAGYSLERASMSSRIASHKISAMEEENWAELPEPVFVKGFIRSLSKIYRTDAIPILRAYEIALRGGVVIPGVTPTSASAVPEQPENGAPRSASPTPQPTPVVAPQTKHPRRAESMPTTHTSGGNSAVKNGILIGLVVVVAFGLFQVVNKSPRKKTKKPEGKPVAAQIETAVSPPPSSQIAESSPSEVAEGAGTPMESESSTVPTQEISQAANNVDGGARDVGPGDTKADTPKSGTPSSAESTSQETVVSAGVVEQKSDPSGQQLIEIVVKEKTSIRISRDDQPWINQELEPETYQYRFERNAKMMLTDAAAVDISFNGRSIGSLGSKGRKRRLTFEGESADSRSEIPTY